MTTNLIVCAPGSDEWREARAGVITASRFYDALSTVGSLTDQQLAYVRAIQGGAPEAEAMRAAGYKQRPTSESVRKALAGEQIEKPSDTAMRYAQLLALERIAKQPLDETFSTFAMRRGIELEPVARALYEDRMGVIVETPGFVVTEDREFGYSSDGFVLGQEGGIEVKTPSASDKVAGVWLDPEPVIAEYEMQIRGGLWLKRWKWIDLVVYTPWLASIGKDMFIHRFHRDESVIEDMESKLFVFSRLVNEIVGRLKRPASAPASSSALDMHPTF